MTKKERTGAYLAGLLDMASSQSEWIGRSYMESYCFDADDWRAEFARTFALREEDVQLLPSDQTLRQLLVQWLGGAQPKLTDSLLYYMQRCLGEAQAVWVLPQDSRLASKLGWSEDGKSPFYIAEDLFFAQFPQTVVCFVMGNNE